MEPRHTHSLTHSLARRHAEREREREREARQGNLPLPILKKKKKKNTKRGDDETKTTTSKTVYGLVLHGRPFQVSQWRVCECVCVNPAAAAAAMKGLSFSLFSFFSLVFGFSSALHNCALVVNHLHGSLASNVPRVLTRPVSIAQLMAPCNVRPIRYFIDRTRRRRRRRRS